MHSFNTATSAYLVMDQFPKDSIKAINLLLPFWIILGIGYEFDNKIVQRSISYGATIEAFFKGKIFYIVIIVIYFLILNLAGYILTSIHFSTSIDFLFAAGLFGHLFIYLIGYSLFCFLFTIVIRKSISALVIFFGYTFLELTTGLLVMREFSFDLSFLPMHIIKDFNSSNENGFMLFYNTEYLPHIYYFLILTIGLYFLSFFLLKRMNLEPL